MKFCKDEFYIDPTSIFLCQIYIYVPQKLLIDMVFDLWGGQEELPVPKVNELQVDGHVDDLFTNLSFHFLELVSDWFELYKFMLGVW